MAVSFLFPTEQPTTKIRVVRIRQTTTSNSERGYSHQVSATPLPSPHHTHTHSHYALLFKSQAEKCFLNAKLLLNGRWAGEPAHRHGGVAHSAQRHNFILCFLISPTLRPLSPPSLRPRQQPLCHQRLVGGGGVRPCCGCWGAGGGAFFRVASEERKCLSPHLSVTCCLPLCCRLCRSRLTLLVFILTFFFLEI